MIVAVSGAGSKKKMGVYRWGALLTSLSNFKFQLCVIAPNPPPPYFTEMKNIILINSNMSDICCE